MMRLSFVFLTTLLWVSICAAQETTTCNNDSTITESENETTATNQETQKQALQQHDDDKKNDSERSSSSKNNPPCSFYLAESLQGGLGIYTTVPIVKNTPLLSLAEPVIPMLDTNTNEWGFWQLYFWNADLLHEVLLESYYQNSIFIPGIGTTIQCSSNDVANVEVLRRESVSYNSSSPHNVHRSNSSLSGSFTYRHNYTTITTRNIQAGEELLMFCQQDDEQTTYHSQDDSSSSRPADLDWIMDNGICLDSLYTGESTIPGIGRGAFASRNYQKDEIVMISPVIHVDRHELNIYEQHIIHDDNHHHLMFRNNVTGVQLLLNYCFGHPNSDLLLLPVGSMVNSINHHSTNNSNVEIRWSRELLEDIQVLLETPAYDVLNTMQGMEIEYVATRDIVIGEEVFLDYGQIWQQAWDHHNKTWKPVEQADDYVSAADYERLHKNEPIRTIQDEHPSYPSNIQTACYFQEQKDDVNHLDKLGRFTFRDENRGCLRPCTVLERQNTSSSSPIVYTARMDPVQQYLSWPQWCHLSGDNVVVANIPESAIRLIDKPYTSDLHLPNAFRHEIGVPDGMYPEKWFKNQQPVFDEIVKRQELQDLQIAPMRTESNNKLVHRYAQTIGIPESVTKALLDYCNRMGITDKFRSLIVDGNALKPGGDEFVKFGDYDWYVQRPDAKWRSNMHWISPANEMTHIDYLRALKAGGFDAVLESVGKHFRLEGLVCYHLTFIGVNHCSKGFSHYDFTDAHGRAFNMIIPLILKNESGPELEVSNDRLVAGYKYEIGTATLIGDDAYHATAACDYRDTGEMRMAATVYMADIREDNVGAIVKDFTQAYPKRGDSEYVLSRAHSHWKSDDPTRHLPEPLPPSDFLVTPLEPGQIAPVMLEKGHGKNVEHVYRMGLPEHLTSSLIDYANRMGIPDYIDELFHQGQELAPEADVHTTFKGYNWLIQRPPAHWRSNMHWISPSDEQAHEDFLRALSAAGFDDLLDRVGRYFGYDGLVAYHLTFIAVSYCDKGFVHHDVESIGGQMFNVIVPLALASETGPELEILDEDSNLLGNYKYEANASILVGDSANHATGAVDYRYTGEIRVAATIYIADANEENAGVLMKHFTQEFPRSGDVKFLLDRAGSHWKKDDPSKRLPTPIGDFSSDPLQPYEISQITWASNGEPVTDYAHRVGLPKSLTEALREYCDRTGITEKFRSLVTRGQPLEAGHNQYVQFGGQNYFIQRPHSYWQSNMHWISPADEEAHNDYLKALSRGGFDQVLESIGQYFELDGLSCYHVTFIGVSKCSRSSYMHHDFSGVDGSAFNMIIPLILANETGPELDIATDEVDMIGGYRYEYNTASLVGDDAKHATAGVDYTETGEMRMAATIYMADVNADNAKEIVKEFTQAYPPRDVDYLLQRAGNHWRRDDPSKRLPRPDQVSDEL